MTKFTDVSLSGYRTTLSGISICSVKKPSFEKDVMSLHSESNIASSRKVLLVEISLGGILVPENRVRIGWMEKIRFDL